MSLLELRQVEVFYGGIQALRGVSLQVNQGELVSLIGANGAGKTTTLSTITGLLSPRHGEVIFDGQSLAGVAAHALAARGLVMVPEGRGLFPHMTVEENLIMGAYHRRDKALIATDLDRQYQLFPRLAERRQQLSGTLSGGEQQMVAMGRALMARPRLLLLDEPSMGLAPIMVQKIFEVVKQIASEGVSLLLVEQNARVALGLSQRGYVMEHGEITLTGPARELLHNPAIQQAYLGG